MVIINFPDFFLNWKILLYALCIYLSTCDCLLRIFLYLLKFLERVGSGQVWNMNWWPGGRNAGIVRQLNNTLWRELIIDIGKSYVFWVSETLLVKCLLI